MVGKPACTKELLSRGGIMAAPPGSLLAGAKVHRPHAGACRPGEEHNGATYIGLFECLKPLTFMFFRRFVLAQLIATPALKRAQDSAAGEARWTADHPRTPPPPPPPMTCRSSRSTTTAAGPARTPPHVSFHLSDLHKRRRQLDGSRC